MPFKDIFVNLTLSREDALVLLSLISVLPVEETAELYLNTLKDMKVETGDETWVSKQTVRIISGLKDALEFMKFAPITDLHLGGDKVFILLILLENGIKEAEALNKTEDIYYKALVKTRDKIYDQLDAQFLPE